MASDPTHTVAEMMLLTNIIKYLENEAEAEVGISPKSEWVRYKNDVEPHPWHCKIAIGARRPLAIILNFIIFVQIAGRK